MCSPLESDSFNKSYCKAHCAFTTVLEHRAHVPNDVFGISIRDMVAVRTHE